MTRHTALTPLPTPTDAEPEPCVLPQDAFNRFTQLAARLLVVSVVHVSVVDPGGRLVTSSYGLPAPIALLLFHAVCRHVAASRRPLVVANARRDPLMTGTTVGVPLFDATGRVVGTLCVMCREPRRWSEGDVRLLREVAALAAGGIGFRAPRHPSAAGIDPPRDLARP